MVGQRTVGLSGQTLYGHMFLIRKVGDLTISPIIVRATLSVMDQEKAPFYFVVLNMKELQCGVTMLYRIKLKSPKYQSN